MNTNKEENFSNLGCSKQYTEHFIKTSANCGVNQEGELVEVEDRTQDDISFYLLPQVGFLTESDSKFYWMFTSCHDKVKAHNLWVHHHVLASVGSNDNNNDRPSFSKDGFYSGYDINGELGLLPVLRN